MARLRCLCASASLTIVLACVLSSTTSCTAGPPEAQAGTTDYSRSHHHGEPSPDYGSRPRHHHDDEPSPDYGSRRRGPWLQPDDDDEAAAAITELDDTYWIVPPAYLKAYIYINGAQAPVLDQTVWHLRTARAPDRYIFGRAVSSLFPANAPDSFQPSYGCNRMLGSITPSGSTYISFIPAASDNGTAVTTGLGSFGRRGGQGWAFEMQMGSGTPGLLAAHWAYMVPCGRDEPCFDSLPGVGMSIPEFMAQCGW